MTLNAKRQEQFDIVCERIAEGESLRAICESTEDLPNWRTDRKG